VNAPAEPKPDTLPSFRTKLLVAMMLVVTVATALALFFSQRSAAANARRELARDFQAELAALHAVQEVRHAALAERCRALARKPRIHAALEDNALDLLYPSARDELLDVMERTRDRAESSAYNFRARFYRFLDINGRLIPPAKTDDVGALPAATEARLALPAVSTRVQTGYLRTDEAGGDRVDEIIAMPIFSSETAEPIASLVLGFTPLDPSASRAPIGIYSGIWTDGYLHLPGLPRPAVAVLAAQLERELATDRGAENSFPADVAGVPSLVFYKQLNPGSPYPPAYEVSLHPLTAARAAQRRLLWQFVGAGLLLLLGALGLSHWLATRLSMPVEQLAVNSVANLAGRQRAEAALELTHEELQRSARFSADASHQLKTPVTVLRVGLEELLAGEKLSAETREEISALVHQTFRLTSIIEDLLLLSRLDAGRLQLELGPVDLTQLIDASLDDLGALPDDAGVKVETDLPSQLLIVGERRYTSLILQNLLENARKYNRPGGRIRLTAAVEDTSVVLAIGNTGYPIPPEAQQHIFERFHRGTAAENLPGHGLGLNLARQLARLHRGELWLVRSGETWTEFAVRFPLASVRTNPPAP
jgi:signal transduction histidine kinase